MQEPTFKTTFSAAIRAFQPTDDEIKESKASFKDLGSLFPADIKPEDDPDLLYIVANLAVPGLVNLNDDCLTPEDAVATYKKFEKKQCNIEHNRSNICGFIVKASLTNENGETISEQEAISAKKPFYITTVAALWKVANKQLCEFIVEASNPANSNFNKLSLSFEVGFYSYDIGVTTESRDAINLVARYSAKSEEYEKYDKLLRINKGSGFDKNKNLVFRILRDNIIPLGQGIVIEPAAQVKGIDVIISSNDLNKENGEDKKHPLEDILDSDSKKKQEPEDEDEEDEDEDGSDDEENMSEKDKEDKEDEEELELTKEELIDIIKQTIQLFLSENKIFNKTIKNSVLNSTSNINMKNLQELEAAWDEVKTKPSQEVFASVRQILADEISKASEEFVKKQEEEKIRAETLAKEKADAEIAQAELKKQLDAIQAELKSIKDAEASARKEQSFNDHMTLIDQTFDLDEDETALITAEVRDLDEEAFAKWFDKSKKLMKEKTKAFKAEKKEKMEKKMCDAGVKATVDEKTLEFTEILASAKQVEANVLNVIDTSSKESIYEKVKKAFAQ